MADIEIKGKSDSYDNILKKIVDLNHKLNTELSKSKETLESTNEIYKELSKTSKGYADSLGKIVGASTKSSKTAGEAIDKVQKKVDKLVGMSDKDGIRAIQQSITSISGMLKGNSNFANILTNSLKSTITNTQSLQGAMTTTTSTMTTAGTAASNASAGVAAVGSSAVATGAVVLGVVAAIMALIGVMYKLGEGGYKYQMTMKNAEKTLGSSFKTAYGWANKMNNELGIAEDRTLALISSTAQLGRSTGMDTQSSANMGIGANRLAVQMSNATGIDIESIQNQINSALNGSNSLGGYGINVDDNAAKYWLLQKKGIDAFNGAVSESTMVYARYMLIQEQANLLNYQNAENSNSLAATQLKLKNTMDSLSKNAQAIFLPVFQAVAEILLAISEAVLFVVNGFRELIGLGGIQLEVDGPSQEAVDAAGDLYSQYKKMGDELDALKQQLYGFDEVITQNPYHNLIADMSLEDAGIADVIDSDGGVKAGKKYGEDFRTAFQTVLGKMGNTGKAMSMFFNVDQKSYEEMNEVEQWLNKPGRKFIELAKKGEADTWDFIKAVGLEGLHHMPIVAEVEALVEGDNEEFVKALIQDGLLFNPITWPIGLLWKGFDILSGFKDENGEWDVLVEFLHLDELQKGFESACNWLYEKLSGFGSWLGGQVKSAFSNLNPVNAAVNMYSSMKGLNSTQETALRNKLSTTWVGGLLPKYANGGFMKASHIAQVDPNEVAVPLNNSSAQPAFQTMADRIMEQMSGAGGQGGNVSIDVHLGENGMIIANNHDLKKFSRIIGENISEQLRSTGQLAFGRKY